MILWQCFEWLFGFLKNGRGRSTKPRYLNGRSLLPRNGTVRANKLNFFPMKVGRKYKTPTNYYDPCILHLLHLRTNAKFTFLFLFCLISLKTFSVVDNNEFPSHAFPYKIINHSPESCANNAHVRVREFPQRYTQNWRDYASYGEKLNKCESAFTIIITTVFNRPHIHAYFHMFHVKIITHC